MPSQPNFIISPGSPSGTTDIFSQILLMFFNNLSVNNEGFNAVT
jgi:hypothetical protein